MKRISSAVALVCTLGISPAAADMMGTYHSQTDWSGQYLSLGIGTTSTSFSTNNAYAPADASGLGASVIFGYSLQRDNIVYGAEVIGNIDRVSGSSTGCGLGVTCRSSVQSYAAARMRVGLSLGDTLVFGTLGYATDEQDQTINGVTASSQRHTGPTVGIGVEHALDERWSLRGELEHYRFNTRNYDLSAPVGATDIRPSHTAARVGVSYRF